MKAEGTLLDRSRGLAKALVGWRREFHAHPELSFQEFRTARRVAKVLQALPGVRLQMGVGGTGVLGLLGPGGGPTIALRADMDALPIQEETGLEFASQNPGVMHACGHDAHTAMLLGATHLLQEAFAREGLRGTVKLIFQPAEESVDAEGKTGGQRLVEEGVLEGVEAVVALHVSPGLPVGEVQLNPGYSTANVDTFEAWIRGSGGHGALPHLGTDPIWMLSTVLPALYGLVSRRVSALEPAVASVGQIAAGSTVNVLPREVYLQGTLRSYSPETRERLASELEAVLGLVRGMGGEYALRIQQGEPSVFNDPRVTAWLEETAKGLLPEIRLLQGPFGMIGEDFGHMTQRVPGALFLLGAARAHGIKRDLHTPLFDIDEACLPIGAAILAETARRFLLGEYRL
jgi:amidohydrolase